MGYVCSVCHVIVKGNVPQLLAHLHRTHVLYNGPNLVLNCGQGGCPRTFGSFNSFRKHIAQKHPLEDHIETKQAESGTCTKNADSRSSDSDDVEEMEVEYGGTCTDMTEDEDVIEEVLEDDIPFADAVKNEAAMFISQMLSQSNVTHATVQRFIEGSTEMFESIGGRLLVKTKKLLKNHDIDIMSSECGELFTYFSSTCNPFDGLESKYKQEGYLKQELGLVEPVEIVLGSRFDIVVDDDTGQPKQIVKDDTLQYIPIRKTLGIVLSDSTIIYEIAKGHQSVDGVMRHYCDGRQYAQHPLFAISKDSLQLSVFFDEYEVAKRGVHKVGALYFTIQNLPPIYSSALQNIHLLALFYSIDLVKYGFSAILGPFLEELALLESDDGMEIELRDGSLVRKRGTLIQTPADNLGAHSIGGFVGSFSANFPCRFCCIERAAIQKCFVADESLKRNKENYQEHLQQLEQDPNSTARHGIKTPCALNKSKFFHITSNYSPDIMHDILEGIGKMEVKLVISELITEGLFTLELLNARITNFAYGAADKKNKPEEIAASALKTKDSALKNSAAQMWCLLRTLPLMIGDKVARGHPHWGLLLKLRDIMDITFAREITDGMCEFLRSLVEDHHTLFKGWATCRWYLVYAL